MSGSDLVLVRESAEDLFPADPVLGEVDLRWPGAGLSGCELAEGAVRPGGVVMLKVFGQYLAQMVLIDDQQPVEKFPAQGTDHPLADRVRPRRLRWAGHNPDALRREHGIEGGGELARAILIRNLTEALSWPRSIRKLRAACAVHAPSRFAVMPARWTRRAPCSMTIKA